MHMLLFSLPACLSVSSRSCELHEFRFILTVVLCIAFDTIEEYINL